MVHHNYQPIVGGNGLGGGGGCAEASGWGSAWGDTVQLFGATIRVMKIFQK
jgi:hypothetical protein